MTSYRSMFAVSVAGALALAACGGSDGASTTTVAPRVTINVGHTSDPTSQLLAELYGQGLENAGIRVGRKDPMADRAATMAALEADSVQLVPELSATLLAHLSDAAGVDDTAINVDDQLAALKDVMPDTLTLGPVSGAEATTVIVCSQAAIAANHLVTITDLGPVTDTIKIGATKEFSTATAFGLDALNTAYATSLTTIDGTPDTWSAELADGTLDCVITPQTWVPITVDGLITLDDDKNFFPLDVVVPVMSSAAATTEVTIIVTQISGALNSDVLRALLVKAAVGDQSYDVIAKEFLASLSSGQ